MRNQPSAPLEQNGYGASRDSALQLSRRLDWRFLLPHPHLGRVAYVGSPRETLLAALRQFSESLTLMTTLDQTQQAQSPHASFELVVLRSQNLVAVEKAHALLATGGHLYWEVDRLSCFTDLCGLWRRQARPVCTGGPRLRIARNRLARLGFCNIAVHWHRPNFEACCEIIPLHDQHALSYVFSRDRGHMASRLKLMAGSLLLQTGALPWLVPCYSIVACKSPAVGART